MKMERPRFELARVYSDGTKDEPEIISVGQMPWETRMERRGFLGVGVGIASLLLLLDGKATSQVIPPNQTSNASIKVPGRALKAHQYGIDALTISPDGKILASCSGDIKFWSLPEGKLLTTLAGNGFNAAGLAISPDGKILAAGSANTIKLWSLPEGKLLTTLQGHQEGTFVEALVISPDGKILASSAWDKTIKLWSLPDGKLLATLRGHSDNIGSIAISPDGKTLFSGSLDKTIKSWSLPTGKLLTTLIAHSDGVRAVALSPDGKFLASCSSQVIIKLWSLPERKLLSTFQKISVSANTPVITSDGKTLISQTEFKTLGMWPLPDGKPNFILEGHKNSVRDLMITPDDKILASGDNEGVIILWDLEKRSFLSFLFDPKVNESNAISYNIFDKITGRTLTFTLPCGSPIPPGAVCTCNCVPGTYKPAPSTGGGTYCTCNKVCTCIPVPSDRDLKEAFETTDATAILQKLSELPINKWNYKWDDASIRHIGPMAQDFAAAFEVGDDDKHIHPVDAQGVAFVAIQALYQMLKEKDQGTRRLKAKLQLQKEENKELEFRIESLEKLAKEKSK